MNEINSVLQTDFPDYKKEIQILLNRDKDFREVATDFVNYKKMLGKLPKTNNADLKNKYYEIKNDLKLELLERLRYKYLFSL